MSFTDVDRRTVGNLSIPTNVEKLTHELRVDPYSQTRSEEDVNVHLQELVKEGLVRNLGEHDDAAKLAAKLPKGVRQMPDDQAEIFSRRMSSARHRWRLQGDLYVITDDGIDRLKEPTVDSSPLTPTEVQGLIDAEWARTIKDPLKHNADGTIKGLRQGLANALLEEEFLAWATATADACEKTWGRGSRPLLPLAGGAGWTDVYENSLVDAENQKTALGAVVDPWFMTLTILAFTDTDTGTTAGDGSHVPTYTGFARKAVAGTDMGAASGGSSSNTSAITFAACSGGSSVILGFGNCSASTVGTLRKYGTCSSTTISTTQTPASFAIGAYTTTAD